MLWDSQSCARLGLRVWRLSRSSRWPLREADACLGDTRAFPGAQRMQAVSSLHSPGLVHAGCDRGWVWEGSEPGASLEGLTLGGPRPRGHGAVAAGAKWGCDRTSETRVQLSETRCM